MGVAFDSVLVDVHNAATSAIGLTNATPAQGDSLGVRSFKDTGKADLVNVLLQGSGARRLRLTSPRLHDNVTGVSFQAAESPTEFLIAAELTQPLYSSDVLVAQLDAAASSDTVAVLQTYYSDLPGIDANLATWEQVKGRIIDIKPVEVDLTTAAAIGAWSDTVITATENQLKADYEYALLGFESSAALCAVGIKGPATGNLRVTCPGASPTLRLTDYFVYLSQALGRPAIPVFAANDRAATFITAAANVASAAADVFAVLARLR